MRKNNSKITLNVLYAKKEKMCGYVPTKYKRLLTLLLVFTSELQCFRLEELATKSLILVNLVLQHFRHCFGKDFSFYNDNLFSKSCFEQFCCNISNVFDRVFGLLPESWETSRETDLICMYVCVKSFVVEGFWRLFRIQFSRFLENGNNNLSK